MFEEYAEAHSLELKSELKSKNPCSVQRPKIRRVNRAIRALRTIKSPEALQLAWKIENCRKGAVCSSFWCSRCRHRAAKGLEGRLREYVAGEFGDDQLGAEKRLVFVTPLFGLCSVYDVRRVRGVLSEARKNLKALKRVFPQLWYQGAFELELIDVKALMESAGAYEIKKRTIACLLGQSRAWAAEKLIGCDRPQVLVHAHLVMDLRGVDREKVRDWLRHKYDKSPRQIEVRGIWPDQTLDDLCNKVGAYPFKSRTQYNFTFEAQGYIDGSYFSDTELANLVLLHHGICCNGYKNLLIGSKVNG